MMDRYFSWPLLFRATDLSVGELVRILRRGLNSYGVAEEFPSEGDTVWAAILQSLLKFKG